MIWTKTAYTHCKRGHEFVPENTGSGTNGKYCKICHRATAQRRKERLGLNKEGLGVGKHVRKATTHCGSGHEYTEDNTYRSPKTGYRQCRACHKSHDIKRSHRNRHVSLKYGISAHDVDIMKQVQEFRCAICGIHETELNNKIKLCVDHNHETKEVRSMLCLHCNHGLGNFKDNATFIRNAARYLDLHNYAYSLKVQNEPKLVRETGPEADRIWAFVEKASLAARETSG